MTYGGVCSPRVSRGLLTLGEQGCFMNQLCYYVVQTNGAPMRTIESKLSHPRSPAAPAKHGFRPTGRRMRHGAIWFTKARVQQP